MDGKYKYNPGDFAGMMSLPEDLADFYNAHETYLNDPSKTNRFDFERKGRGLFSTVKHRAVEGFLSPVQRDEIWEHMRDLLDD
ncbi:MAG: hypothetical protein FWG53_09685 [Clostridiales bacterium]|nr:hypothetical protein [Clostridiales bacterium]